MRSYRYVLILVAALLWCQPSEGQFLKKLFKKKHKTEKKEKVSSDGINDDVQTVLLDITTLTDNSNNRNGFLGIPLGIKAERFGKQLTEQGFTERIPEGKQTAKSYVYDGEVYGSPSHITLYTSEQTFRVFAVDVEETTIYPTEADVKERFQQLKKQLTAVYGKGYVDDGGESYMIVSRLGSVCIHYERAMMGSSYTIGFTVDDAKAYQMAYGEMADKENESLPRIIENGLATAECHTDIVGLGYKLLKNKSLSAAKTVLTEYEYVMGKLTAKQQSASLSINDYHSTIVLSRKKQSFTTLTIIANDDVEKVRKSLKTNGFMTTDNSHFQQGKMSATLNVDSQGQVVLQMK